MAIIDSVKLPDNSTYDVVDDTSGYQKETLATPITINGTQETTVEGALGELNDYSDALKTAISHENLLDNPFFTVNEKGFTSGMASVYNNKFTVNGWLESYGSGYDTGVVTKTVNGMHMAPSPRDLRLMQAPDDPTIFDEKTLTFTVYYAKGNTTVFEYLSGTLTNFDSTVGGQFFKSSDNGYITASYIAAYGKFIIFADAECTVKAVKLELGSVSTLANDIEPNKTLETLACQKSDFSQIAYQNLDATTARKAYNAGQYFFNADGDFCRAKTDILLGATLTDGTNYEKTTVAVEMAYSNISTGITGVTAHLCGNVVVLQIQKSFSESTAGLKSLGTLPASLKPKSAPLYFCGIDDSASSHANNHPINCSLAYSGEISAYIFSDKLNPSLKATVTYIR